MLARMGARTLLAWQAYAQAEPFGEERADLRTAMLCALIANIHRAPDRGQAFAPADFMPQFGPRPPRRAQTFDEMRAVLDAAVRMTGGARG